MANHEQGNSQESLTKRDQEVIQLLVSQIVREAGIHSDPEREATLEETRMKAEAKLERRKLQAEATKTQVLISSGLLVGLAAVIRLLPQATLTWPLFLAFLFVLTSVISGIWEMRAIAQKVRYPERTEKSFPFTALRVPLTYLVGGMLVFFVYLVYEANNILPGAKPANDFSVIARVVGAGLLVVLLVVGLLVTGEIGRRILRQLWPRTESNQSLTETNNVRNRTDIPPHEDAPSDATETAAPAPEESEPSRGRRRDGG